MKTKKNQQPTEITLLNSREWLDYEYEDYLDWCNENDQEPAPDGSSEYIDWCINECQINFDCNLSELKYNKEYEYATFVITGKLGLWHGTPTIEPVTVNGLVDAIEKCFGSCDDIIVKLDKKTGVINVQAMHHDGTNYFEIRKVRDYCLDAYRRAVEAYEYGETEDLVIKDGWFQKIHVA